jgi:hypothetical protein
MTDRNHDPTFSHVCKQLHTARQLGSNCHVPDRSGLKKAVDKVVVRIAQVTTIVRPWPFWR